MEFSATPIRDASEIELAIELFAQQPNAGLIVLPSGFTVVNRDRIIASATHHLLPAVYAYRFFAVDGGLMSYGNDVPHSFSQAASYVDRILRGDKPGDLPVQAQTKFQMVINLTTAKALGLTVPNSMLLLADELID